MGRAPGRNCKYHTFIAWSSARWRSISDASHCSSDSCCPWTIRWGRATHAGVKMYCHRCGHSLQYMNLPKETFMNIVAQHCPLKKLWCWWLYVVCALIRWQLGSWCTTWWGGFTISPVYFVLSPLVCRSWISKYFWFPLILCGCLSYRSAWDGVDVDCIVHQSGNGEQPPDTTQSPCCRYPSSKGALTHMIHMIRGSESQALSMNCFKSELLCAGGTRSLCWCMPWNSMIILWHALPVSPPPLDHSRYCDIPRLWERAVGLCGGLRKHPCCMFQGPLQCQPLERFWPYYIVHWWSQPPSQVYFEDESDSTRVHSLGHATGTLPRHEWKLDGRCGRVSTCVPRWS